MKRQISPRQTFPVGLARLAFTVALLAALASAGCKSVPRVAEPAVRDSGGSLLTEQAAFDVGHYDLQLRIDPKRRAIEGVATVEVRLREPLAWLVLDLDTPLRVQSVQRREAAPSGNSNATELSFEQRGGRLWIDLGDVAQAGERAVVSVVYDGKPRVAQRPPWDGGFTWDQTKDGQPWIATSCQTEGADLWFPCKDHPSDKPESFTLRVTVPEALVVAANGRLVEVLANPEEGTRTFHWHTSTPISNYNVALNIAPYKTIEGTFDSVSGDVIPVTFWVLPENEAQGKKLFPELKEHLAFYERVLGPYPFRKEKYGVVETPHLGMEHQTIIAYGNRYRGGPHGYDWLHHHELGHEWWGNLVTASDWRHFWIHEGFCTYMQALYAEEREGAMAYHHALYQWRRQIQDKHPMVPRQPAGMHRLEQDLGNDPYYKGAWILHTLRYLIGDDAFFQCLRRMAYPTSEWETRPASQAVRFVESQDFANLVNEVTGRSYDWFFEVYLYRAPLPDLKIERHESRLELAWDTPGHLPFPMPVEIQIGETVERLEMTDGKLTLDGVKYGIGTRIDPRMRILRKSQLILEATPDSRN